MTLFKLFRSDKREIERLKNEADKLKFENVDLRQENERLKKSIQERNGYLAERNETIRGYKSENTKLKNQLKKQLL